MSGLLGYSLDCMKRADVVRALSPEAARTFTKKGTCVVKTEIFRDVSPKEFVGLAIVLNFFIVTYYS